MNTCKYFFVVLALAISQSTVVSAAEEKISIPPDSRIATCLVLMTMNDDWHELYFEINNKPDVKAIVSPFEKKLDAATNDSCTFLFEDWDAPSRTIINDKINEICSDDPGHSNPYLVNSLQCKQARATP